MPLMPKEEIAGTARPPVCLPLDRLGQQLDLAPPPSRPWRRARRRAASCGRTPSRIASTILITPATPAAAWVWPMFDLIEPSYSGSLAVLAVGGEQGAGLDRVAERGAGAVGLDDVDVPGSRRAFASAWRITRSCEGPLGAVSPLEAPSWLTAEPRIVASTGWPFALGVGEALEQQHADALRQADPVGRLGEGLAAAVRGEAALAAELDEGAGGREHRHAAGERQRALTGAQRLQPPGAARPATTSRRCRR